MRFSGERRFDLPRRELWDRLHDPAVLARTLPECERFEGRGDGTYAGTVTIGAAGARGCYRGRIEETEVDAPASYRLLVTAAGAPGTLDASTTVHLDDQGAATLLRYEVDATVGGAAAAMGSQLLAAAADRATADFLDALAVEIARPTPGAHDVPAGPDSGADGGVAGPDAGPGAVDRQHAASGAALDTSESTRPGGGGAQLRRWLPTLLGVAAAVVAVLLTRRSSR